MVPTPAPMAKSVWTACKECQPGDTRECYSGPNGTAGVGICRRGTETCNGNGNWGGSCQGEVTPANDVCDGLDNNCDGVVDGPDACTGGKTCVGGTCRCANGQHDCGGACVSNTSPQTCGTSCIPCPAPTNGTATCDGVNCSFICNSGFHRCGSTAAVTRMPSPVAPTACPARHPTVVMGSRSVPMGCVAFPATTASHGAATSASATSAPPAPRVGPASVPRGPCAASTTHHRNVSATSNPARRSVTASTTTATGCR